VNSPYVHRIRVRYGEVDMQQVVFNAHYLAYCDDALETWWRVRGLRVAEAGWDAMLKRAVVEWQSSATAGDTLDIRVEATRWGNTSFDVTYTGTVDDRPVFTAVITYVGVRFGTTQPIAAPDEVREKLS
jgi:acyl-CoA thioester hydrolase